MLYQHIRVLASIERSGVCAS